MLILALSILVGLALGLLGGGGSILTVPLLTEVAGLEAKPAIATSLLVVGLTSAIAAYGHARRGRVRWGLAALFGSASMVGAYAGARVAAFIPGAVLMALFAVMMVATAIAMLRRGKPPKPGHRVKVVTAIGEGLAVGAFTGMVGAGGGFLVVPVLVVLGGLTMYEAVGTSLVVIAMKSFAGLAGYLGHVDLELSLAALVTAGAVGGALVGARFADKVPEQTLKKSFAVFVLVLGVWVLIRSVA